MSSYVTLGVQTPSRATDVTLSVLRMQAPSASNAKGLCVVETLTAVGKVGLEFGLQLAVGAVMVVLVVLSAWFRLLLFQVCRRERSQSPAFDAGTGSFRTRLLDARASDSEDGDASHGIGGFREHSLHLDQHRTDSARSARAVGNGTELPPLTHYLRSQRGASYGTADGPVGCDATATGRSPPQSLPNDGTHLPLRARYITAAVNFIVTAYSTVTVATIKMLHCVWVPGAPRDQQRLFVQGSVVCNYTGWQVVYVIGIAVLVAVPVILFFVTSWAVRRSDAAPGERVGAG
jgi:hypothetical protein